MAVARPAVTEPPGVRIAAAVHRLAAAAALAAALATGAEARKFGELARTPPMGWNSWNGFHCDIDEQLVRETAEAMVASGMKDAGYEYVVIDDCWQGERDEAGSLRPDPERFPSGMEALAAYVHSLGLKLGIYSDAGWKSCAGRTGSRGREYQDALTFARWGIDYLKYDWCNTEGLAAEGAYLTMREALFETGRPIVFSICEWGDNRPWEWAGEIGHLWRTTGDIHPCWDCEFDHGTWSSWGVLRILDMQQGLRKYAGPGRWNDPDMLEVGNGMTAGEDRAHFSIWSMLAAPLIAGNDLRRMSETTRAILTNREVIAVDQDPLGIQGFRHSEDDGLEIWFRPLDGGDWAMMALNRRDAARTVEIDWRALVVADELSGREARFDARLYRLRNLWTGEETGSTREIFTTAVAGHDVLMLRLLRVPGEGGQ